WKQELRLPAFAAGDAFGTSVALNDDGTIALVGAPHRAVGGHPSAGVADVYRKIGAAWFPVKLLSLPVPHNNDTFGFSVSLNGSGKTERVGEPRRVIVERP